MSGALTQLVALGAENQYLTGGGGGESSSCGCGGGSVNSGSVNNEMLVKNPSSSANRYQCYKNQCILVNDENVKKNQKVFNSIEQCLLDCSK